MEQPFQPEMLEQLKTVFPSIYELYLTVNHEDESIVGAGCDDQFEFEFALDLMLDGIERLKASSPELTRSTGRIQVCVAPVNDGRVASASLM